METPKYWLVNVSGLIPSEGDPKERIGGIEQFLLESLIDVDPELVAERVIPFSGMERKVVTQITPSSIDRALGHEPILNRNLPGRLWALAHVTTPQNPVTLRPMFLSTVEVSKKGQLTDRKYEILSCAKWGENRYRMVCLEGEVVEIPQGARVRIECEDAETIMGEIERCRSHEQPGFIIFLVRPEPATIGLTSFNENDRSLPSHLGK